MVRGSITALVGPMFGGKSSRLLVEIDRLRRAHHSAVVVRYESDTRYTTTDAVVTHRGVTAVSEGASEDMGAMTVVSARRLRDVDVPAGVTAVGIDEGQFFGDLEHLVAEWAAAGKEIVVAALNGDYKRRPFPRVSALLALATAIHFFPAVCRCGADAPYSKKIVTETPDPATRVLIGGAEKFRAMCPACYHLNR